MGVTLSPGSVPCFPDCLLSRARLQPPGARSWNYATARLHVPVKLSLAASDERRFLHFLMFGRKIGMSVSPRRADETELLVASSDPRIG